MRPTDLKIADTVTGTARILVCNCENSMPVDGEVLARAFGTEKPVVPYRHLCRSELDAYRQALATGERLTVCCAQEAPLFAELAEAADVAHPRFVDIRDRAGWSSDGVRATPKMAALIAEAIQAVAPTPAVSLESQGAVLVLGRGDAALEAAGHLSAERAVTCLLIDPDPDTLPPFRRSFAVLRGRLTRLAGHLGAFSLAVAGPAALSASSRAVLRFDVPGPDREMSADIVLDLTGGTPLLAPRDGYLRIDPGNAPAVQDAVVQALGLLGEFEKPRYIRFDAGLCAHSRNQKVACTRCLDACPSGAIIPAGDHVRVDPAVCMGHGACVPACPTGAMNFDFPAENGVLKRLVTLLRTYGKAGGEAHPRLLVYEATSGDAVLSALARFGDGLPADVLPLAVGAVGACGLDFLLTAVAQGVGRVTVLSDPARRDDLRPLEEAAEIVNTAMAALGWTVTVDVVVTGDPDGLAAALAVSSDKPVSAVEPAAAYLPMGDRRSLIGQALGHLSRHAPTPVDEVPLLAGAPFGAVELNADKCTLCLSCIGVCPTGALTGHAERPSLGFLEANCVQCGLCRVTCPEKVISLTPRLNLRESARTRLVLKEEEPHHCSRCGKPFGTKSSISMLLGKLSAHPMFAGTGRLALIEMCEDCRVVAQYEMEEGSRPFQLGQPRVPRTTDDYLREREEAKRMAAAAEAEKKTE